MPTTSTTRAAAAATRISAGARPCCPIRRARRTRRSSARRWREMWLERLKHKPVPAAPLAAPPAPRRLLEARLGLRGLFGHQGRGAGGRRLGRRLQAMPSRAWSRNLKAPAKGIIGPWIHKYPHFAVPKPAIGFLQEALRWWDRWLKDIDTGVENDPAMRVYRAGQRAAQALVRRAPRPLDRRAELALAEHRDTTLQLKGDRTLGAGDGQAVRADRRLAAGLRPGGRRVLRHLLGPELPGDQRRDDALSLTFDSAAAGRPARHRRRAARAAAPQGRPAGGAMVACGSYDVHPDGASTRITYGVLNLCHSEQPRSPEADSARRGVRRASCALDDIAYRVAAGNRLRAVDLQRLLADGLALARTGDADDCRRRRWCCRCARPRPATSGPSPRRRARPPWNVVVETAAGATAAPSSDDVGRAWSRSSIEDDFGALRDQDHGPRHRTASSASGGRSTRTIRSRAKGETWWEQINVRDGWSVRTDRIDRHAVGCRNVHNRGPHRGL